jgi:hypothetical protein
LTKLSNLSTLTQLSPAPESSLTQVRPLYIHEEECGADEIANESGVNEGVTSQFPGSTVQVGGTKRGENPTIPDEEGGELNKASGRYVSLLPPFPSLHIYYHSRDEREQDDDG